MILGASPEPTPQQRREALGWLVVQAVGPRDEVFE